MAELFHTSLINDANLALYLRMEGNSNATKGSPNGTDTSMSYSSANGKYNQGAGFNGSSSFISFGNNFSYEYTQAFSIACWTYPKATGYSEIWNKQAAGGANFIGYGFEIDSSSKLNFFERHDNTTNFGVASNNALTLNIWNHIVATTDGSGNPNNVKIYINGASQAVTVSGITMNSTMINTNNACIGRRDSVGDLYLNGNIDDFAIFTRVLNAQEVKLLYLPQGGLIGDL